MVNFDLYQCDDNDDSRFILGKNGAKIIFVVGLNPSYANMEKSDVTVSKVRKVAFRNGFDGFVMTNLYPKRSTYPGRLPAKQDQILIEQNCSQIVKYSKMELEPVFWAAWGENITIRPYFFESLKVLQQNIDELNGRWLHFGDLTVGGHPRHPSRLSYKWVFSDFDVITYLRKYT